MKKLLGILVLGLLLSGNVSAENIKLKCVDPKVGIPVSVVINTKNENVSFQGSNPGGPTSFFCYLTFLVMVDCVGIEPTT